MSDFGDMLREALTDDEPYRPEPGEAALEAALEKFGTRMRTVRFMGTAMVFGPTLFCAAGVWLFLDATEGNERVLGVLLTLFGLGAVGMAKMWFHAMVSHVQVMKELKVTQLLIARLADDVQASKSSKA